MFYIQFLTEIKKENDIQDVSININKLTVNPVKQEITTTCCNFQILDVRTM